MDWEDVKTFAAVARHRTVRRAAAALKVHHSTVSRRIERLEQNMSVRFFDRRPEGLVLTDAGESLLAVAERVGDDLIAVERRLAGADDGLAGHITVTMAEPLAERVFMPAIGEFMQRYPNVEIRLLATGDLLDVSRREADVAIRCDNNPPDALVGKRLFAYHVTVYAAAGYLAEHDLAADPESGCWVGYALDDGRYPAWARDTEFADVPARGVFPELSCQIAAVKAGLGIAILPCFLGDATAGIERATARAPVPSRDVWLLTHSDLRRTARIRAFMQFAETILRDRKDEFLGVRDADRTDQVSEVS